MDQLQEVVVKRELTVLSVQARLRILFWFGFS